MPTNRSFKKQYLRARFARPRNSENQKPRPVSFQPGSGQDRERTFSTRNDLDKFRRRRRERDFRR